MGPSRPVESLAVSGAPAVVVVGFVVREGSLLLVQRAPWVRVFPDAWGPFGGHVESGEHLEEALCREAREELGIDVRTFRPLGRIHNPKEIEPAVIHVYAVYSWDGEPVNAAPEEHTEIRWFRVGELPMSEALDTYGALLRTALR